MKPTRFRSIPVPDALWDRLPTGARLFAQVLRLPPAEPGGTEFCVWVGGARDGDAAAMARDAGVRAKPKRFIDFHARVVQCDGPGATLPPPPELKGANSFS